MVLQSNDPREFVAYYHRLKTDAGEESALRRRGRRTAARYAWSQVLQRNILPALHFPRPKQVGA